MRFDFAQIGSKFSEKCGASLFSVTQLNVLLDCNNHRHCRVNFKFPVCYRVRKYALSSYMTVTRNLQVTTQVHMVSKVYVPTEPSFMSTAGVGGFFHYYYH
jgi:hypothetical protein